jgi:hypothetical protein
MNSRRHTSAEEGSGLLIAVVTIAVLALLISAYFGALIPKYRSVHQAASWHEAHESALAGANYAMRALNEYAKLPMSPDSYNWTTDFAGNTWAVTTADAEHTLAAASLPKLGGRNHSAVTSLTLDVYTRHPSSGQPWFRIRSTARADLPGKTISADRRDSDLRRMNLTGKNSGAPDPHVSRVVEVITRPKFRFARAITMVESISLGSSSGWLVDSYDSSDTSKSDIGTSAGGVYPSSAAKQQANGGIAVAQQLPPNTYDSVIDGQGATVRGDVKTAGGDNPATSTHENVTGSGGMDQARIYDDFSDDLSAVPTPIWSSGVLPNPSGLTNFTTSTNRAAPARYVINGNVGGFAVLAPASGTGFIELMVNGKLGGGDITIPPSVSATIYVSGDVDFGNSSINANSSSSQVASRLLVYGLSTASTASYSASGSGKQILAFYGPAYAIHFSGNVDTYGAVIGKNFSVSGGGNGGLHFDEALLQTGPVTAWEVAGYFEDARTDVR